MTTAAASACAFGESGDSAWTEPVHDLVLAMDQDLKSRYPKAEIEVRVSGKATANARAGLEQHGWKLVEDSSP